MLLFRSYDPFVEPSEIPFGSARWGSGRYRCRIGQPVAQSHTISGLERCELALGKVKLQTVRILVFLPSTLEPVCSNVQLHGRVKDWKRSSGIVQFDDIAGCSLQVGNGGRFGNENNPSFGRRERPLCEGRRTQSQSSDQQCKKPRVFLLGESEKAITLSHIKKNGKVRRTCTDISTSFGNLQQSISGEKAKRKTPVSHLLCKMADRENRMGRARKLLSSQH